MFKSEYYGFIVISLIKKKEVIYRQNMYIRGAYVNFPDFFRMGTHKTLDPFKVISSGCNALIVPFQQLPEGPMEVLLCERINYLRHSLFPPLNCLLTTASELRE